MKLTSDQKKQLEMIQKGIDAMLDQLLTEEQRKQLKGMQGPTIVVGGPGGRGGPPGGSPLFRAYRFAANFPGFAGRDMTPGKTLEEMQPKQPEKKEAEKKEPDKKEPEKKENEKTEDKKEAEKKPPEKKD